MYKHICVYPQARNLWRAKMGRNKKLSLQEEYRKYAQTEEAFTNEYINNTQNEICFQMQEQKLKQKELAKKAKMKPQQLHTILLEGHNTELKTIGKIAFALKKKAVTCLVPKNFNPMLFAEIIDVVNKNVNDENFLKHIMKHKKI